MILRDLAHARTGDKGDVSNIAVVAHNPAAYQRLAAFLTPARVRARLGLDEVQTIQRHELPTLGALNFVIHGLLAGGVTRSAALDAHGKCLGAWLLGLEVAD